MINIIRKTNDNDTNKVYTNLNELVNDIKKDLNEHYMNLDYEINFDTYTLEEEGFYKKYLFYPNKTIEITDGNDGIFIEVNGEYINKGVPIKYVENIDTDLLAPYILDR